MAALPDRPSVWIGVVLGGAAAYAAMSWTAEHPVVSDLVSQRLARADADSRGLSMWEIAALRPNAKPPAADAAGVIAEVGYLIGRVRERLAPGVRRPCSAGDRPTLMPSVI
jgi:hypothetical protein